MTQASEILASSRNSNEGIETAERESVESEQDWENEATLFTFADDSVLMVMGGHMNAYTGPVYPQYKVVAGEETGEWIGGAEFVDYVLKSEWDAKTDTNAMHFDTFEKSDQGTTCAIEVTWVD